MSSDATQVLAWAPSDLARLAADGSGELQPAGIAVTHAYSMDLSRQGNRFAYTTVLGDAKASDLMLVENFH